VIDLIKGVRSVRAEMNVPAGRQDSAGADRRRSETSRARLGAQQGCHSDPGAPDRAADTASAPSQGLCPVSFWKEATVGALPLGDVIDFAKERAPTGEDLKKRPQEEKSPRFDAKTCRMSSLFPRPPEGSAGPKQREKTFGRRTSLGGCG